MAGIALPPPQLVRRLIRDERSCAEHAYYRAARDCMESFARIPDVYLRERALDIRDVAQRVMRHLTGDHHDDHLQDEPAVCIAHDLTPSETAQLDRKHVLGFAVEQGSKTSHTAIICPNFAARRAIAPPWLYLPRLPPTPIAAIVGRLLTSPARADPFHNEGVAMMAPKAAECLIKSRRVVVIDCSPKDFVRS